MTLLSASSAVRPLSPQPVSDAASYEGKGFSLACQLQRAGSRCLQSTTEKTGEAMLELGEKGYRDLLITSATGTGMEGST